MTDHWGRDEGSRKSPSARERRFAIHATSSRSRLSVKCTGLPSGGHQLCWCDSKAARKLFSCPELKPPRCHPQQHSPPRNPPLRPPSPMEDDQPAVHWQAMGTPSPSSHQDSPDALSEVQRQQQEQLAYYENLHRQRQQAQAAAGGAAAASASAAGDPPVAAANVPAPGGRAAQLLADADAANAVRAPLPQFEERLLDPEDIAIIAAPALPEGQYRMPDGRLVGDISLEACKARAAAWIKEQIAWQQRSGKNAAVLVMSLMFLLSVCAVLVGLGAHHLGDDFDRYTAMHDPSDTDTKRNSCSQLPIFLIVLGAIGAAAALLLFALTGIAAKQDERLAFRFSFPLLCVLLVLSCCFALFLIIGVVWVATTPQSECPTELYRASLFTVLATVIVGTLQAILSCLRCCCHTSLLPI